MRIARLPPGQSINFWKKIFRYWPHSHVPSGFVHREEKAPGMTYSLLILLQEAAMTFWSWTLPILAPHEVAKLQQTMRLERCWMGKSSIP